MDSSANILNWFEVSVSDIARAKKFYEAIFSVQLEEMDMMGMKMASFPYDPISGKLSGALVQSDMHKPSADGVKIYFNGNPDLDVALSKVEAAGGKVAMPKTKIGDDMGSWHSSSILKVMPLRCIRRTECNNLPTAL